jgi:malate synthase
MGRFDAVIGNGSNHDEGHVSSDCNKIAQLADSALTLQYEKRAFSATDALVVHLLSIRATARSAFQRAASSNCAWRSRWNVAAGAALDPFHGPTRSPILTVPRVGVAVHRNDTDVVSPSDRSIRYAGACEEINTGRRA